MPYLITDIKKIESVQATFTRKLCKKLNIKYDSYFHRLQLLNLETLELRRVKIDLIITYKIINNLVDINSTDFLKINLNLKNYNLRRNKFHLIKSPLPNYLVSSNFFSHRVINAWNSLPDNVVCSNSLQIFKFRLNNVNPANYFTSKL